MYPSDRLPFALQSPNIQYLSVLIIGHWSLNLEEKSLLKGVG